MEYTTLTDKMQYFLPLFVVKNYFTYPKVLKGGQDDTDL
jgi:hypothetical protein